MKISNLHEILVHNRQENQRVLKYLEEKDEKAEGILTVRSIHGKNRYYKRTSSSNNTGISLGLKKSDEIARLERKNYFRKLKKVAEENIIGYLKAEKALKGVRELDEAFLMIPEAKRHLIQPYYEHIDEEFANRWRKAFVQQETVGPNGTYSLSNGIKVRSKSELIIGERLISAGVPFYYEIETVMDHIDRWRPDFYVLNKRTKQTYFWEHFGMMDNPEYSSNVCEKITAYARNDIMLGKNLIISMESQKNPLDTEYIDQIIKHFLL